VLAVAALGAACAPRGRPAARGVVSLVPSVTEIVFALSAESCLTGTTNQCDYPERARHTTKVGDFAAPDVERLAALRPGLVFVALPIHRPVMEKLGELGIACRVSDPQSLEAVLAEVESVAAGLGLAARGRELASSLRRRLESLPAVSDTPRVYVEISSSPLMTVGGGTFVSDLVRRAGGRNVFADVASPYPVVSPEEVALRDPEVVLVLHPGTSAVEVARRLGWERTTAVRSGRVHADLDEDILLRPGPRAVDGVLQLHRLLHPGE